MIDIELDGGGRASIDRTDGDRVSLVATRAFPPGSTLEGSLSDGSRLRVKVRGSKQSADGFAVEGRFVNLSRDLREKLVR